MVVKPVEKIGIYGGSWKLYISAVNRLVDVYEFAEVGLLKWNREQNASIPCLAETWKSNETGTEFTVKLRKGLKWSDGKPFTADDVIFWWNDVVGNSELTPVKPYWMYTANRKLGVVEKTDETTVVFQIPRTTRVVCSVLHQRIPLFRAQALSYLNSTLIQRQRNSWRRKPKRKTWVAGWLISKTGRAIRSWAPATPMLLHLAPGSPLPSHPASGLSSNATLISTLSIQKAISCLT